MFYRRNREGRLYFAAESEVELHKWLACLRDTIPATIESRFFEMHRHDAIEYLDRANRVHAHLGTFPKTYTGAERTDRRRRRDATSFDIAGHTDATQLALGRALRFVGTSVKFPSIKEITMLNPPRPCTPLGPKAP